MNYTQLTREQRYQIHALLKMEHSQTEIADALGVHRSTISRELQRNCARHPASGRITGKTSVEYLSHPGGESSGTNARKMR
jgi:IS30 family transposase